MEYTYSEKSLLSLLDGFEESAQTPFALSFYLYLAAELDGQKQSRLFDLLSPEKITIRSANEKFKRELAKKFAALLIKQDALAAENFGQAFADKLTAASTLSLE